MCLCHLSYCWQSQREQNLRLLILGLIIAAPVATPSQAQVEEQGQREPYVSQPVEPRVFEQDVRSLPRVREWRPGDPVRVIPQGLPEFDQEPGVEQQEPPDEDEEEGEQPDRPVSPRTDRVPDRERSMGEIGVRLADFEGIPATGNLPPDTVGDVGPNHYVQMVNVAFAIFDKSGSLLAGPSPINLLWSGFGGPCETQNNGDPIVLYDQLEDRWLMSQFAVPGGELGFHECIAISRTSDPVSGGWFLYDFQTPTFPDYPKFGIWPDAYYMSTYEGATLGVFAFDRAAMLVGNPATFVRFTLPSLAPVVRARTRILPSDLDGVAVSPAGSPNYFVRSIDGEAQGGGVDRLEIYEFSVNFANPAASAFSGPANVPVQPFDIRMCGPSLPRNCIPQPTINQGLDPLSNRLMHRLQYRNMSKHEAMVVNQTINVGNDRAAIRWYELRRQGGSWSIHQQGTYAPDEVNRWMGSVAMDRDGNIALGYSVSDRRSVFPGIRYAGRLVDDPLGTLPQGEFALIPGAGAQTHSSARWGDYSSMSIDPTDDCTFWYTSQYYPETTAAGWRTRIASFRFPECGKKPVIAYKYAAKIVCGVQEESDNLRMTQGIYATAVNILNQACLSQSPRPTR